MQLTLSDLKHLDLGHLSQRRFADLIEQMTTSTMRPADPRHIPELPSLDRNTDDLRQNSLDSLASSSARQIVVVPKKKQGLKPQSIFEGPTARKKRNRDQSRTF